MRVQAQAGGLPGQPDAALPVLGGEVHQGEPAAAGDISVARVLEAIGDLLVSFDLVRTLPSGTVIGSWSDTAARWLLVDASNRAVHASEPQGATCSVGWLAAAASLHWERRVLRIRR